MGGDEYSRVKRLLNVGKHPTFIGRNMVERWAKNGGLLLFCWGDQDVGVMLVNPRKNVLMVMNVLPAHRGHGLGAAMLNYAMPNWVRAVESAVPFFLAHGYTSVGALKRGRALNTRVMVRAKLMTLAGRVARVRGGAGAGVLPQS